MKKLILISLLAWSIGGMADQYVNGYTRKDGTYVKGHYRTDANNTRNDNYSTRGNSNPYTGAVGYGRRDGDSNAQIKKTSGGNYYSD